MALREELEREGTWLFRYRSWWPPLLLLPLILAAPGEPGQGEPGLAHRSAMLGLAVAGLGLLVRALVVGHAPRGTSGKNRTLNVAESLTTTGLYSVVRHPLYLANLLLWLGPAVAVGQWWAPVLIGLIGWQYHERLMFAEEEFLRKAFGESYLRWAAQTPALLPNPRHWRQPAIPFSFRTVLRQEYYAVVSTVVLFGVLEASTVFRQTGRLTMDRNWLTFVIATLAAGSLCRFLQRYTQVLDVEGR